jgi:hypothetical protein
MFASWQVFLALQAARQLLLVRTYTYYHRRQSFACTFVSVRVSIGSELPVLRFRLPVVMVARHKGCVLAALDNTQYLQRAQTSPARTWIVCTLTYAAVFTTTTTWIVDSDAVHLAAASSCCYWWISYVGLRSANSHHTAHSTQTCVSQQYSYRLSGIAHIISCRPQGDIHNIPIERMLFLFWTEIPAQVRLIVTA